MFKRIKNNNSESFNTSCYVLGRHKYQGRSGSLEQTTFLRMIYFKHSVLRCMLHCRTVFGTKTNMVHLYHIRPNMVQMYHTRTEDGTIFDRIWYKHCTIFGWNKFFYARQNVFGTYQKNS